MKHKGTRSKYGAVPTVVDNVRFASKRESARYRTLKIWLNVGAISGLELQPRFDLVVNGKKVGRYVADFRYKNLKGESVVEDAKGMPTPIYKLKKRMVEAQYGIEIQEV